MDRYLIASSSEKGRDALQDVISQQKDVYMDAVSTGGELRRLMLDQSFDIVVINAPLSDENGIELACDIIGDSDISVILVVKAEFADQVSEIVEDYGIYVITKPINRTIFYSAIKFVLASRKRINSLYKKQTKLQKQIEDIKYIDRAKCCLIEYLGMTEQQAHRYIEKQAMDMRKSKRAVSEDVLKTYEM
ncbi:MAG: hypothetical protein BGN88_05530 [Clostridiales bacterium 43-6]|nr:MAG: hypothetical protein BGN88_05530 [Clostridiales bacterium 43-6]